MGLVALSYVCPWVIRSVHAEPARVALSWQAPVDAECATAEEIQSRVARLTDHTLTLDPASQGYRILAEVVPRAASWRAHIALLDAQGATLGTREVLGRLPDCQALDVPVVLVISMLLDDLQEHESRSLAAVSGRRARDARVGIGATATGELGLAASPALGVTLMTELPVSRLPLLISASSYLATEQIDTLRRGIRSSAFHAGASLCPRLLRAGAVDLQLCGGAQLGVVWAIPLGLMGPARGLLPILMFGLEPRLLLELTQGLVAQLSIAANWAAVRPNFDFDIEGQGTRRLHGDPFVLMARIGIIIFLPFGP